MTTTDKFVEETNAKHREIYLEILKRKSGWLREIADDIVRYSNLLSSLPNHETDAEMGIALAFVSLEHAMKRVSSAHNELNMKRQMREDNIVQLSLLKG